MINLTTNTKSFSVEKGTAGGKTGSGGSSSKVIKQIIYQGSSGSGGSSVSTDVFTGATETNAGRQGLVPQPLAGQNTLFLKGNGIWDKVFRNIREDEEGNIYIDGKATKFGSDVYLNNLHSNIQDSSVRKAINVCDDIDILNNAEFYNGAAFYSGADFVPLTIVDPCTGIEHETNCDVHMYGNLWVDGNSNLNTVFAENITVDYLTVTKLAHFFELMIDQVRASKGQIIITAANAKIDYIEENEIYGTMLYWRADSEKDNGSVSINEFVEGDQIICQSFNRGQLQEDEEGKFTGSNVSNKYYGAVVSNTGQVRKVLNEKNGYHVYNWISVRKEKEFFDGEFKPEIGDEIVQLGNRSDTTRQAAIIISAYNNAYLDKGIKAPAIVQYDGINDFQLEKHRLNVISKGLNRFMGSYLTPDGKTDIVEKFGNIETTTSNKFSEIQQTIDGITTKVSNNKTSIDTLTGKVTTNEENISKIDQKADRIQAQVEQNQTNFNGHLTTINNSIANLQIKAEGIQTTVSQHTTKIDDLTGKVTENQTNISKIDQKADKIQSTVTKIEGDYVTSSTLTQTSKEILAQVSNTYIKINDGKVIINAAVDEKTGEIRNDIDSIKKGNIELNGNTTINGNLTIQNATDGLTLVGTGGTTEIRSKDIGNFFDYIKNPTKYWEMKQTNTGPGMYEWQDGNTYKEKFVNDNVDAKQTISIPANTKVTFANTEAVFVEQSLRNMGFFPMVIHDPDNTSRYRVNVNDNSFTFIQFIVKKYDYIWTFVNKDTGALIRTFTGVDHGEFTVTTAVPNCQVRVQVYAYIDKWEIWKESFDYGGKHYTLGNSSKVGLMDWAVPIVWTHFTMTSQDPTVNNLIGYNGQAYNFGGGNGMFIGSTGLQAKFGDYTFMINPKDITNRTESGNEVFQKGIWCVNKYKYTTYEGPFNDFETAKSQFLTQGRSFGARNVRAVSSSGKICVLPEDDIIIVSDFLAISGNTGKIDVQIYFPPCNGPEFDGHEVKIMQIHKERSSQDSTCKVFTKDDFYPFYSQSGNHFNDYNFGYETRTFIPNFLMGCWIMI